MLLLDSQAAVWVLDDNPRLGARARDLLTSADKVYVSAATVWELTIKAMLGKISIPAGFSDRLAQQGFAPLAITPEHAEGIREFPELARHDPFDRLLVSQAHLSGLRLLTADRMLLGLKHRFIVDATE